ncbi:MAG: DUF4126 domain-containing protein [Chloroflexota bacterium]
MTAQAFLTLATAFGLSTAAGLNAYIPLFLVALLARTTSLVTLNQPYTALSSWWVIATLAVLLLIEILVDKIPAVDTVNDVIQTFVRPAAGAILFAASTNVIGLHPALAAICGVIVAGGVHIAKTVERPVVTATTAGVGDPIVSTVEDAVSFITSVLAVVAPYLIVALAVTAISLLIWWAERRRRRPDR